jgi:hypothetical protein
MKSLMTRRPRKLDTYILSKKLFRTADTDQATETDEQIMLDTHGQFLPEYLLECYGLLWYSVFENRRITVHVQYLNSLIPCYY